MTHSHTLRFIALPIVVASFTVPISGTQATETAPVMAQLVFNNTQDPADGFAGSGRPVSRSAGGARGGCDQQLVALLPGSDTLSASDECSEQSPAALALTTSENPIVWVHVPALASPTNGELVLLDADQQAIAAQTVPLSGSAGVIGIAIESRLEMAYTYSWVFTILDDTVENSEQSWVEGMLRRVESDDDLVTALNGTNTLRDQAAIWAQRGIWHEALTALATLQQTAPDNVSIAQDWQIFLDSVGLGAIANAPVKDCCY